MEQDTDLAPSAESAATKPSAGSAMLIDLTPGAIVCGEIDGEMESFDDIGGLLEYLLGRYRMAEEESCPDGALMAGYDDDATPQRDAADTDAASARRA